MSAAAKHFADIVRVGPNVKTFAAHHAEIDLWQADPVNGVAINVDKAGLALHHFSLPRQFVERHAGVFLGRDHRRDLIKIAAKFLKRRANCGLAQLRHWFCLDDVTLSVLRAGACAERERADVFLVFTHQQILDFGSAPDR